MNANSWRYFGCRVFISTFLMMGLISNETMAAPVTLNFQSTVNLIEGPLNGGPIALGDTIAGSFTYESTTPLFEQVFPGFRYHALIAFNITVGSYSASFSGSPAKEIFILSQPNGMGFISAISRDETGLVGSDINGLSLQAASAVLSTDTAFSLQQLLPPHPLPAALADEDFTTLTAGLLFSGPSPIGGFDQFLVGADPLQAIPIPSSLLLFGTGLVSFVSWRWWNTKTA